MGTSEREPILTRPGVDVEMRAISLILIVIGGLILGYRSFESRIRSVEAPPVGQREPADPWRHLPLIVGGIALVVGLIMLVSSSRRDET